MSDLEQYSVNLSLIIEDRACLSLKWCSICRSPLAYRLTLSLLDLKIRIRWGVNLMQIIFKKPGFRLNGNAMGIKEKSENFNGLRQILFEACKKTTEVKLIFPPPSRNRVKLNTAKIRFTPQKSWIFMSIMNEIKVFYNYNCLCREKRISVLSLISQRLKGYLFV